MGDQYQFPLQLNKLIRGQHLPQSDLRLAIHQHIHLLLTSFALTYRFDPYFGATLNKYQGTTPPQRGLERSWREEMRSNIQKNIKDLLQRYETRIDVQDVLVRLLDPNKKSKNPEMKVRVEISGQLTIGRKEKFYYPDSEIAEEAMEVLPLEIPVGNI